MVLRRRRNRICSLFNNQGECITDFKDVKQILPNHFIQCLLVEQNLGHIDYTFITPTMTSE